MSPGADEKPRFDGTLAHGAVPRSAILLLDKQDTNRVKDRLTDIFGGKTQLEASYPVYAQATYYPQFVKVYVPNKPMDKLLPFMEGRKKLLRSGYTSVEDKLERSLRRSKNSVRDLTLCNQFDLFVTFTFSPKKVDRQDANAVKRKMNDWLHNQQKRKGKFNYLIVPEFHKDRKSLHFHALIANYPGKMVDSGKRINSRKAYNLNSYKLGHSTAIIIDDIQKVSGYVRKYIVKDMPLFHGRHRYWASRGLKRPVIEDNPSDWYLHEKPLRRFLGEYGLTLYFPAEREKDIREGAPDSAREAGAKMSASLISSRQVVE